MPHFKIEFKTLRSRIAIIFLSLILMIQAVGFSAIRYSIDKNARHSVDEQLQIGEKVFVSLLDQNGESLSQAAKILATDYGFRQAIGSNDDETISSALSNHQSRINADIAIFYSASQNKLILSGNLSQQEALNSITKLLNNAKSVDDRDFEIFKGKPYQLVAVPIKAPLTIGWIIMGFEINNILAKKLHKLSNLEVTFISQSANRNWDFAATTLGDEVASQLVQKSRPTLEHLSQNENSLPLKRTVNGNLKIQDTEYGTRYVEILNKPNQSVFAVLQRSIDEATAPYQTLQINLLVLTIFGALVFAIAILYVAKKISSPITQLANTAAKLGSGQYELSSNIDRSDEIGNLGRAFNKMSEEIANREEYISKLAYWDQLTELPNRFSFIQKLSQAITDANKNNASVSVIVMNLDRFKKINTVLGHESGNKVLRDVAIRMQSAVRQSTDFVARLSGDEFAILLPNSDSNIAFRIANDLEKRLEIAVRIGDQHVDVSASIGIASYPEHADSEQKLFSRAELAMQVAKEKQYHIAVFDSKFDATSLENLSLASDLKTAIASQQLRMYVQPKVDLTTGIVTSAEALIRWIHPERGQIFPDQFIPFAEQTGLIQKISIWMLHQAASSTAQWRAEGKKITIAVNLSTRDLIDADLPAKLQQIIDEHDITAEYLSLEITESSIMDDPQRALDTLKKLSLMGFKLAIDDFGTGYSSLAYLKKLPIDELKIDKSFVLNVAKDKSDVTIVKSTIDLGHNLNLKVVAEGIENQEAWDLLASLGCDFGQGYFMSQPMPATEFSQWLDKWDATARKQATTPS
jgi:diguanylate cyclase (GGDEF)-like protein